MSVLRAALVTPMTGPLARYGRAGHAALHLWATQAADLPHPWRGVRLEVYDAYPDAGSAIRTAEAARPHVLFGPYGSSPAVAAAEATTRVIWNHGGATSRLAWPTYPHVVNVLAPAATYYHGVLQAVRAADPEARTVCILHVATDFARDVARGATAAAEQLEFHVTTVTCPPGGAAAAARTLPQTTVLLVAGGFDDELAAAGEVLPGRWPAIGFVGAGTEEVLEPLGARREGLLGPAQWTADTAPEPDEGPDAAWFVEAYRAAEGGEAPYPAAQAFAAGVLYARCLRDAGGPGDAEVLAAAVRLRCTTLYGAFALDPTTGAQVGHKVRTVQWQAGVRRVVWPSGSAGCPLVYPRPHS